MGAVGRGWDSRRTWLQRRCCLTGPRGWGALRGGQGVRGRGLERLEGGEGEEVEEVEEGGGAGR